MRIFRSMNYSCYGVDPGQWVEDRNIVFSIDDLPIDLKFDIIILQDVIEHVYDPLELLTRLKMKAHDGCVFFCSFPCNNSRPARKFKGKWAMVRPYGHLHYFSFDSAKKMFELADLTVKDMRLFYVTPLLKTLFSWNIKGLIYEIVKGGKDQIYAQVLVKKRNDGTIFE